MRAAAAATATLDYVSGKGGIGDCISAGGDINRSAPAGTSGSSVTKRTKVRTCAAATSAAVGVVIGKSTADDSQCRAITINGAAETVSARCTILRCRKGCTLHGIVKATTARAATYCVF